MPSIELSGTIDPATEKWIDSALGDAADEGAPLVVIRLDTPGGLDSSMRAIIQDIVEAPMPVVVYVSPDTARAASAGAFITEAADVAAMAPQTNIGSASAVTATGDDIGGTLGEKVENDASAFIRALAESHGRNGAVAETMVTEAENFTAAEALEQELIDLVVASEEELIEALDGFAVKGAKAATLETAGLVTDQRDMTLQYELLQILVNPNIAFLLLLVGIIGIAIELFSPGLIIPGTLGVVSFLLGAFGTSQLPVTAVGIALLVVGIAMIIAEAHLPTNGIVGAIGAVALVASGLLLFDTGSDFDVSTPLVIGAAIVTAGLLGVRGQKGARGQSQPGAHRVGGAAGRGGRRARPAQPAGTGLRPRRAVEGDARRRRLGGRGRTAARARR